jgi:hypothetical protein
MNSLQGTPGQTKRGRLAGPARRWALAAGTLAAAAGVAAAVLTPSQTPAYAVTPNGDGTVTIVVNDIADPAGANRILRKAGVRATVMLPKAPSDCPASDRRGVTFVSFQQDSHVLQVGHHPDFLVVADTTSHGNRVRIRPGTIPTDQLVIITPVQGPDGPTIQVSVSPQPGPTCVIDFTDSIYNPEWRSRTPGASATAVPTPAATVSPGRPRLTEPTSSTR